MPTRAHKLANQSHNTSPSRNTPAQDSHALDALRGDLEQFPILPRKDQATLEAAMVAGDTTARDKLIAHNMRIVYDVADTYAGYGVPYGELLGEGFEGMIRAA